MSGNQRAERVRLSLHLPWTIAHGRSLERETILLHLGEGIGEAAVVPYLGESADAIAADLSSADWRIGDQTRIDSDTFGSALPRTSGAACAVDIARHDQVGRMLDRPVWDLLGLPAPRPMPTSISIPIDDPDRMAARAKAIDAAVIKVKVGGEHDEEAIEAIRGATQAALRLDANGGWSRERAAHLIPRLARFGIELIEQPLPAGDRGGYAWLADQGFGVPIFVDESVASVEEIERVAEHVDGVVIKLRKFGGIGPAHRGIVAARARGLRVMIGCMIESSVAVTAAAHLGGICDLFDLDAPLLIANDPYVGIEYSGSLCSIPNRPGIGVTPRI